MDIRQMKYFKTIVEEGTISKAAQVLHMAQPPLSIQLKQLEEELGITLLKRGNKQIELTDAGMRFYKRCLQILDLTEITKNELKESFQDVLRIGITSSNGGLIQQDNIKHFIEHYDHVQYRIYEGSTYEILDLLLSHNIDLGIVRTPFDTSKVNTFYLEKEPMIVIGKKEYFKRPISKMKDLKKIPLIIHQRYLPLINDYSLNKHIQIQIKVTCDDSRTSLIWANSGIGVAIVPLSSLSLNYDSSLEYAYLEDKDLYTGIDNKNSRMLRAIAYEKPLEEIANKLMRRREPQRRKVSSSQESLPAVEYKETPKTPQNPDRRHENEPDISGTAGRDRGLS